MRTLLVLLAIVVLALACDSGGGEGDTTNYYGTDDDDAADDSVDDDSADDDADDDDDLDDDDTDDDDDDTTPGVISGRILDFGTGEPTCESLSFIFIIEAVDNETAEPFLPAVTVNADEECNFTLLVPEGTPSLLGLKFSNSSPHGYVTYLFDVAVGRTDVVLYFADKYFSLYTGMDYDDSKGFAFGIVEWEGAVVPEPVGCATISPDRFMGAAGEISIWDFDIGYWRDTTPLNGFFMAFNATPQDYAFQAEVNGEVAMSAVHPLFAGKGTQFHVVYPLSGYSTNPTPEGCE